MGRVTITLAVLLIAAAGCASTPEIMYRTVMQPCPVAPPAARCPDWPVSTPKSLSDALAGLGAAWSAWDACRASAAAWERAWGACAGRTKERD